ncbi:Alpha-taxilin [Galemys pyrenaicus]|uniref:Alpha-taxilin n=1 Tax=Galemys pyrenaicus TaxID=202257 RepID=A0A8J6DGG5_GALPY|nr:Alpha-taxilin [Galemys pyrenaicus]
MRGVESHSSATARAGGRVQENSRAPDFLLRDRNAVDVPVLVPKDRLLSDLQGIRLLGLNPILEHLGSWGSAPTHGGTCSPFPPPRFPTLPPRRPPRFIFPSKPCACAVIDWLRREQEALPAAVTQGFRCEAKAGEAVCTSTVSTRAYPALPACREGAVLCREVALGKRRPLLPASVLRPRNPGSPGSSDRPETGRTVGSLPVQAGQFVLSTFVRPVLGSLIQAAKNFKAWKIASVFVSKGPAPNPAWQTTMKNQDKKNGAAKQSGNTSNPKTHPEQPEAGPEAGQGRPSQAAPAATEAESSSSQAPGKTEGVCQLCFACGRGKEFVVPKWSFCS